MIFLSASRGQGHFSSKNSREEKAPQALPSRPSSARVSSQPEALLASRLVLAAPLTQGSAQDKRPLPFCEDEQIKVPSPKEDPAGLDGSEAPVCLQPQTVPGRWGCPMTRRVGLLCLQGMTSTSQTHSSAHPLRSLPRHPSAPHHTFAPHHSLPP